jgi:ferritin-like metal-binding protein YciE
MIPPDCCRRGAIKKEVNMGFLSSTELNSLDDLLLDQVKDLYDAEHRLVDALPKMADAATSTHLRNAFLEHLEQTRNHVARLEKVFASINIEPERETCAAMKGLITEGSQAIDAKGNPAVKDAALIAAAQRVEHYEMAGYGSARTFAEQLGLMDAAGLLQATLDEEGAADHKLTQLATQEINQRAQGAVAPR